MEIPAPIRERFEAEALRYRTAYVAFLERERTEHDVVVAEVLLELTDAARPGPWSFYRVVCGVRTQAPGGEVAFLETAAEAPQVEPLAGAIADTAVAVGAFAWSAMPVWTDVVTLDHPSLAAWISRWIDRDGAAPDAAGLSSVVHNVSPIASPGGGSGFSVDMGSAPTAAALELLRVLRAAGARQIRIGAGIFLE